MFGLTVEWLFLMSQKAVGKILMNLGQTKNLGTQ
jgi:hypothetical protein